MSRKYIECVNCPSMEAGECLLDEGGRKTCRQCVRFDRSDCEVEIITGSRPEHSDLCCGAFECAMNEVWRERHE